MPHQTVIIPHLSRTISSSSLNPTVKVHFAQTRMYVICTEFGAQNGPSINKNFIFNFETYIQFSILSAFERAYL